MTAVFPVAMHQKGAKTNRATEPRYSARQPRESLLEQSLGWPFRPPVRVWIDEVVERDQRASPMLSTTRAPPKSASALT